MNLVNTILGWIYGRFAESQFVEIYLKNAFSGQGSFVEKKHESFMLFSIIW